MNLDISSTRIISPIQILVAKLFNSLDVFRDRIDKIKRMELERKLEEKKASELKDKGTYLYILYRYRQH